MRVLVIGTGAIGSFYGSLLALSGAKVSVVARSDYEEIKAHGINIKSESKLGSYCFRPQAIYKTAAEVPEKPDYVLICTKMIEGVDPVALVKGAVGPETSLVLIANGIEVEKDIAKSYPENELISGLAFVCVTRTSPGHIWHQDYGRLVLGRYPIGLSKKVQNICDKISAAGIECQAHDNILAVRWEKCVWNAPFNPLSVLSGGLKINDILATEEPLIRGLMKEVCDVASTHGFVLPSNLINSHIDYSRDMKPYKTSMLVDYEAGRPMETEIILGNIVRAGQRKGCSTPLLDTLYAVMKLRELCLTQGKKIP